MNRDVLKVENEATRMPCTCMTTKIVDNPRVEDFRQAGIDLEGTRPMIYLGMIEKWLEFRAIELYSQSMKGSVESHMKSKPARS